MNRREFTASMAAMATIPALPISATAASTTAAVQTPPMAYMFADLIARARGSVDAGFLARRLRLPMNVADQIMGELATEGVIQMPGLTGVARAVSPMPAKAITQKPALDVADHVNRIVRRTLEDETTNTDPEPIPEFDLPGIENPSD